MLHILKPACSFLGEGPFKKDMQLLRCLIRNITFSLRKIWFLTPQTSHPVLLTHTCLNTWAADFFVKCWNVSLHQQTPRVNMNHAILFHKLPVMGIPSPLNGKLRGCFQVKKSFLFIFKYSSCQRLYFLYWCGRRMGSLLLCLLPVFISFLKDQNRGKVIAQVSSLYRRE